ncbi:hypothetical protein SDC9_111585 [bioreactor metagenome]|uniref:N-acetyltransferase domain-containing protein n=1 Tax=bioreactor metagenome TaxID=1076179 RepID=A0A645BH58_9ZZZZ
MEFRTKDIRITPLKADQLKLFFEAPDQFEAELDLSSGEAQENETLKNYCREVFDIGVSDPKKELMYTVWLIIARSTRTIIGTLRLHGPANEKHEAQLSFQIEDAYQNSEYSTQALKKFCEWAFSQNTNFIQVSVPAEDETKKSMLLKSDFILTEEQADQLIYELERPKSFWTSIYMCMGLSLGLCFGSSFDNIAIGMCIGLSIGLAVGTALDASDKKNRMRDKPQENNKK